MKHFVGKAPAITTHSIGKAPPTETYTQVASFDEFVLYQGKPQADSQWITLKLAATGVRVHKANYWLAWNPETKELARGKNALMLKKYRPALCWRMLTWLHGIEPGVTR